MQAIVVAHLYSSCDVWHDGCLLGSLFTEGHYRTVLETATMTKCRRLLGGNFLLGKVSTKFVPHGPITVSRGSLKHSLHSNLEIDLWAGMTAGLHLLNRESLP